MSDGSASTVRLDRATASRYARAGLANVAREYPNQPMHLLTGPDDLGAAPSKLHPVFFGSYDWHSSVHQHWMLVRLLRRHPDLPEGEAIRTWFGDRFTETAVAVEADYLTHPHRRAWERPYGWAWLLTLTAELLDGAEADPDLEHWAARLQPLAATVRDRCLDWLDGTTYPQRSGTHANSAFACGLLHDVATTLGDRELVGVVGETALRWYGRDAGYAAGFEPSANDFLSPGLVEADLLSRILAGGEFTAWFHRFLPDPAPLTLPAVVSDPTDPQTVHLDGLNLSRAWAGRPSPTRCRPRTHSSRWHGRLRYDTATRHCRACWVATTSASTGCRRSRSTSWTAHPTENRGDATGSAAATSHR